MIKNNLAVILAERGLKIGDAHTATGISRNTLSSFVNSKANGIQYDTLNKLCEYLDVTPGEILTYIKFEVTVLAKENKEDSTIYEVKIKLQEEVITSKIIMSSKLDDGSIGVSIKMPPSLFNKLSIIPKEYIMEELGEKLFDSIGNYDSQEFFEVTKFDD